MEKDAKGCDFPVCSRLSFREKHGTNTRVNSFVRTLLETVWYITIALWDL